MYLLFVNFFIGFMFILSCGNINSKLVWYFKRKELVKVSKAMDYAIRLYYQVHTGSVILLNILCKLIKRVNKTIVSFFMIIVIIIEIIIFTLSIIFSLAKNQVNIEIILLVISFIQIALVLLSMYIHGAVYPKHAENEEKSLNIIYNNLQQIKSNANQDNIDEDTTNSNS